VDNQIIHPARCYGLWQQSGGKWASKDEVPYFYRDFDKRSAENLHKLDKEYTNIRDAVRKYFSRREFPYMLSYLELENLNHSGQHRDILSTFRQSEQLATIQTPVICIPETGECQLNINTRFFTDDIPFGLLIAKWVADKLRVATPFIDEIISWAQGLRGESFLDENGKINLEYCLQVKHTTGIPEAYGIQTVDDILD
jgi:hypothetical protein